MSAASSWTLFLLLVAMSTQLTSSAYMSIGATPRCLTMDKPRDTPVTFFYEILDAGEVVTFDMYYGTAADSRMSIMHEQLSNPAGSIEYVTDVDGDHLYCMSRPFNPDKPPGKKDVPVRFKVLVNYGYGDVHYQKLAKDQEFDAVNLDIRKLNDMMDLAINEASYQKYKEMEYHDETEAMNAATLWWPVAQIGILVLIGVFQVRHLKHFFKTNKLI
jgi:hypothetical protein